MNLISAVREEKTNEWCQRKDRGENQVNVFVQFLGRDCTRQGKLQLTKQNEQKHRHKGKPFLCLLLMIKPSQAKKDIS